jgi:hypothetical protein
MSKALEVRYRGRKLRGLAGIKEAIDELPRKLRGKALQVGAEFLLKKFKLYPRYKEVARAKAYPEVGGFFSEKQRRFVMAGIKSGRIVPGRSNRTMQAKNGWRIEGKGTGLSIVNDTPAAVYLYSPIYQARQLDLVGWKDINEMTEENQGDALLEIEVFIFNQALVELDKSILNNP